MLTLSLLAVWSHPALATPPSDDSPQLSPRQLLLSLTRRCGPLSLEIGNDTPDATGVSIADVTAGVPCDPNAQAQWLNERLSPECVWMAEVRPLGVVIRPGRREGEQCVVRPSILDQVLPEGSDPVASWMASADVTIFSEFPCSAGRTIRSCHESMGQHYTLQPNHPLHAPDGTVLELPNRGAWGVSPVLERTFPKPYRHPADPIWSQPVPGELDAIDQESLRLLDELYYSGQMPFEVFQFNLGMVLRSY